MDIKDITKPENLVYQKPSLLNNNTMHYCPGCSHGVVHKLVAEVLEEMGMGDQAVGIAPVGCSVFAYNLAAIGTAETIHASNRGENIVIIFINNGIYGMTGGQMAPTTLLGMKTVTCPDGRTPELNGYPLVISKILSELDGTCYVTRQSVHTAGAVRKAKKALRKAFENSLAGKGTSVVEFVSTCNTGWKMSPAKANEWMSKFMVDKYALGDIKDVESKGSNDEVVTMKI